MSDFKAKMHQIERLSAGGRGLRRRPRRKLTVFPQTL